MGERCEFWTPVARGRIYCSPGCGGDCTRAAFDKANRDAVSLARRLGPGFSPNVSENLGWHFQAVKGAIKVSQSHDGTWTAYFDAHGTFLGNDKNPRKAVELAIAAAKAVADKINNHCEESALTR